MINWFRNLFVGKQKTETIHDLKNEFNVETARHAQATNELVAKIKRTTVYKLGISEKVAIATGRRAVLR